MGESFFSPCTGHVSMYLRPGTVILSFILSHGVLFLLVSLAIKVETCDGYTPTVQQLGHMHSSWDTRAVSGPQRRRAIYRADGTCTHRE
jgi:hypothetical protein